MILEADVRRFLLPMLLALLACGSPTDPQEPVLRRVGAAAVDTTLTLAPATVASLVNDVDTVIATVKINGTTCGTCLVAWRNLDSTRLSITKTYNPPGQSKANAAVVKSLAVGTAGIRAGFKGKADTTTWTITTPQPPPDTTGVQAAQADSFVGSISVQLHLGQGGIYDQFTTIVKPRLLELGVRHIRERMFNDAGTQAQQQDLAANGIKMTAGCWPISNNTSNASHCLSYANAYGTGVIDAFDGWNEVDGQGGLSDWKTSWVNWQQTMYSTYKGDATWNSLPVLANSITSTASTTDLFNTKGNQSSRVDGGNMHDYPGGGNTPEGGVEDSWVNINTSLVTPKPLWTTETGYHTCPLCTNGVGVSELAQAKYTGRIYFEFWRRGRVRTNLYELIDEGTSTTDREDHWGLVRFDNTVKPSFTTVKSIIALLGDAGASFAPGKLNYTLSGTNSATRTVLLQKRNGVFYLVIWQALNVYNPSTETDITNAALPVTLTLPNSRPWKTYKPRLGTAVQTSGTGTSVSLSVPDEILVVEVDQ